MIATDTPRDSTVASSSAPGRHVVIYDGDCGLCRTLLALLLRADRDRALRPLALGTAEADALLADLAPAQRAASWHLVDPGGLRTSAGAAIAPLLRLLPGGAAPAALFARLPGPAERGYRLVAGHRDRLGPLIPHAARRRASALVDRRTAELAGSAPGDPTPGRPGGR